MKNKQLVLMISLGAVCIALLAYFLFNKPAGINKMMKENTNSKQVIDQTKKTDEDADASVSENSKESEPISNSNDLETIEKELEQTNILDEDFSDL